MHLGKFSIKIYWKSPQFPPTGFGEDFPDKRHLSTLKLFCHSWWAPVLRGVLAISFGLIVYSLPALTVKRLVILFAVYAMLDGFVLILHAVSVLEEHPAFLISQGLIGIGIGVLIYEAPDVTALSLVLNIAARSTVGGVLDVIAGAGLRKEIEGEFCLISIGLVSILFVISLIVLPAFGILAVAGIISTYTVILGVMMIVLGFRLGRLSQSN